MRLAALTLIVAIGLTATAEAQMRFAAPHPQPSAESTVGLKEVPSLSELSAPGEVANEQSRARMDKFNQRLAKRSDRAIRSICAGCATAGVKLKTARRIEANAEEPRSLIEDPAQAPAD